MLVKLRRERISYSGMKLEVDKLLASAARRIGIPNLELSRFWMEGTFFTWHRRPRNPLDQPVRSRSIPQLGIVVQGPFVRKHDFTMNTLKFYRRLSPSSPLVFSTWEGELMQSDIKMLESEGVTVVENPKPPIPGPGNINLQIVSTRSGLAALRAASPVYAVKLRSDQRLYSQSSFLAMASLLEHFPAGPKQGGRMGVISTDTFSSRVLGASDFMQFANFKDMMLLWDIKTVVDFSGLPTWLEQYPETYLWWRYLRESGRVDSSEITILEWQRILRDYFLVIDASSLDFFWPKYSQREYLWRRYSSNAKHEEVTHSDWLALQLN